MEKIPLSLICSILLLLLSISHAEAVPDIRGEYSGSYTIVVSSCTDSDSNGTYNATLEINISTQTGSAFSGAATGTFNVDGVTATENIQLSGTITESGQISGTTSHTFLATGGEGTFTGQLNGDTLTIENTGHDTYGETCSYIRRMTATREVENPIIVDLTDLSRVPIFNNINPNDQSVTVTISPNLLPAGKSVTLEIVTLSGSGDATFDSGQRSMIVSNTTTVKIRGVVNSSAKDNIKLIAKIDGDQLDEIVFSVRTWPENFRRVTNRCTPLNNGVLEFDYTWDSESGNDNDLMGMGYVIGEWVDYPGNGEIYRYPSPPYGLCSTDDPHIFPANVNDPRFYIDVLYRPNANFHDDQRIPCGNNPEGWTNNFEAVQHYWFHDPLFMDAPFNWGSPSSYKALMGPITISRIVYKDSGTWKYRIEKHGCPGEINLRPRGITGTLNGILNLLLE